MTTVTFFGKPGCANNERQKRLLRAAGHDIEDIDLLTHPWTEDELFAFFRDLPTAAWFNKAAPKIKNGEVVPVLLSRAEALDILVRVPLLIRRPLMIANGERRVGFDIAAVDAWIGLGDGVPVEDVETCRKPDTPCPAPGP